MKLKKLKEIFRNSNVVLLTLLLFTGAAQAQVESPLKVSYKFESDNSLNFDFEKTDPGTYTVILKIAGMRNASIPERQILTVKGFGGSLIKVKPDEKDLRAGFNSYSVSYTRGKLNPKYDKNFVYLLPYKKATKVRASEAPYASSVYFGTTRPEDYWVFNFYTAKEEPVTAIRKGMVVEIKDTFGADTLKEVAFSTKINTITIEHSDGTLATYKGFKKGSISVKLGQTVFPGTVLGQNSTRSSNSYLISLSLTYLKTDEIENSKSRTMSNKQSMYGFVTPHFFTEGNPDKILVSKEEYMAADNPAVVQKELTKKELKQVAQ